MFVWRCGRKVFSLFLANFLFGIRRNGHVLQIGKVVTEVFLLHGGNLEIYPIKIFDKIIKSLKFIQFCNFRVIT